MSIEKDDVLKITFREKILDHLFWLRAGLTWRDRLRLLWYWLSPHFKGHREQPSAAVRTAFLLGRPIYLRAFSTDVRVLRRVFDRESYALPTDVLGPVSTVVDLGANCGVSTLYFADRYPDARILAVEPDLNTFECLVRNVRDCPGPSRISTSSLCVADRTGTLSFASIGPSDGRRIVDSATGSIEVPCVTLTDLLDRHGFHHVDFLKMDIEGAEALVFKSVSAWLDRIRWAIIEVHFDAFTLTELAAALHSSKRRLFIPAGHRSRRWLKLDENLANSLPKLTSTIDVLVSPDQAFEEIRLVS